MKTTQLWINDEWVDGASVVPLENPQTGEVIAQIGYASALQAQSAIDAAASAFETFRETPAHERAAILRRVAGIIAQRKEEAARIIATEAAKPITAARGEINRTIQTYELSAEAAKNLYGELIPMDAVPRGENHVAYSVRKPLGVVSAITPFNFPFNLVAHKVGPAIAAGNTIVLKPAEQTPMSALFLADVFREAGLYRGVLHIVPGSGRELSEVLTTHPKVKFITFTGSPRVGKLIREQAGLSKVTLELGSNAPLIVDEGFGGDDLDKIVTQSVFGAFAYNGQVCISIQRIYVHDSVYETFLQKFVGKAKELVIGSPFNEETNISALINETAAIRLRSWLDNALSKGAVALCGGTFDRNIMHPTVLTNVPVDTELNCEEAFGPIVTITPFHTWDEAISMANHSKYGLNAGVFTKDVERAFVAAERLESGGVLINEIPTFRVDHMPYGGIKLSGSGREGVKYAVEEMMETKFVSFRTRVYEH